MDMELANFFAGIFHDLRDTRLDADKAWQEAQYSTREYTHAEYAEDEIGAVYGDIEFAHWDEKWSMEPAWTDGEEMYDIVEMNFYDAECLSDAQTAWAQVAYNNNK